MKLYGLRQCSTTQKVIKHLAAKGINIEERIDIRDIPPTKEEIKLAIDSVDGSYRKILNTSGQLYRDLGLKDKLDSMTEDEIIDLLSQEGMLIKRPLIVDRSRVSIGSRENLLDEIWQ